MCSCTSKCARGAYRVGSCIPFCQDEAFEQALDVDGAMLEPGWAGSVPSSANGFVDDLEQVAPSFCDSDSPSVQWRPAVKKCL